MKNVSITCGISTDNLTDAEDAAKMMARLFTDLVLRGFDVRIEVESEEDTPLEFLIEVEDDTGIDAPSGGSDQASGER